MGTFNIHAGHNPAGKIASGAAGILNESIENRKVKKYLITFLRKQGHTIYDCTCNNGSSQNDVLYKIVAKCNAHRVDCDVSIHLNSGGGHGAECEIYGTGGEAERYAKRIQQAIIRRTGYTDRGVKVRRDLYVLRRTNSPAVLVECCFVDSQSDAARWNPKKMAAAICEGLTGSNPLEKTPYSVQITTDALHIRRRASRVSRSVGTLHRGDEVIITAETRHWGKTRLGWIAKRHTKRI